MKVLFVAGFGPIAGDVAAARRLYHDVLGIGFEEEADGYLHTAALEGVKQFGVWPLEQAAESCFGKKEWPRELPVPQAWLELDVEDLEAAGRELEERGYRLLVAARTEPWGQVVSRLLSPEGILLGLTVTPWMRA